MADASSAFKMKCPSCEAGVTIRDPKLVGKKIDCPKCKFRFVVEAPAVEGEEPKPVKKAAATASKSKTVRPEAQFSSRNKPLPQPDEDENEPKKKKSGANLTLIVGGGLGFVTVGIIVAFLLGVFDSEPTSTPAPNSGQAKGPVVNPGPTVDPKKNDPKTKVDPISRDKEKPIPLLVSDITNMLPEDSQWVMRVSGREFMETPIGAVLFEESSESARAFKRWMGFGGEDIERLACAGVKDGSLFGVLCLKRDLKIEDLQSAMQFEPKPLTVRNRNLWTIKSNDLFAMMGDYLAMKANALGMPLPKPEGTRILTLFLADPKTLVLGDQAVLKKYLDADLKRSYQTTYRRADEVPDPMDPKEGMEDPKAPKKSRAFSTNPSFLTIAPALKIVLNQLEGDKTTVVGFAAKVSDADQVVGQFIKKRFAGAAPLQKLPVPQSTIISLVVRQMDESKLNAVAAFEYPSAEEAAQVSQNSRGIAVFLDQLAADLLSKRAEPNLKKDEPKDPNARTVAIDSSDKYLTVTLDLEWKPVYYTYVSPGIRSKVDLLKGEALMLTGKAHWQALATAAKGMGKAGSVPPAAYPRAVDATRFGVPYPPEQRVSWMADLLPYLGYDALARKIQRDQAWNYEDLQKGESNLQAGSAWIPEFLSREYPESTWRADVPSLKGRDLGATHFIGLSGIGVDAANYPDTPEYAMKLGMFGYNRPTRFADVAAGDGLANTIFMIQVPPTIQRPWIRGGGATVQGVPETGSIKPFVSVTKDGKKGTHILMADGSIRFVSETISDEVFKGLATYKGGEKIDNLDQFAPAEKVEAKLEGKAKN